MESAVPTSAPRKAGLFNRYVSPEALSVSAICMLDLLTTLYWVAMGQATEGNPVMAHFLHMGAVPFIIAKLCTFVPAVIAAEWYRSRNPALIQRLMRWVIVFYLFIYVVGVLGHYGRVLEFYGKLLKHFLFG